MEVVCVFYALIISFMLGKAVSNIIRERNILNLLIVIGSFLFFFSDLMLLFDVFANVSIIFDIDGPNKGSNTIGKDIFCFNLDIDNNEISMPSYNVDLGHILTTGRGLEAANWVINFDNMDYLKANTSGKCSNSNVTLNALANPPVVSCK